MRRAHNQRSGLTRTARRSLSQRSILATAIAASMASIGVRSAQADGTWVGGVVSFPPPYRSWTDPNNWNGGVVPNPANPLYFGTCGNGSVDLGGVVQSNPSITFGDWVTYTLTGAAGSTLQLTGAVSPQFTVGNTVQATYGSNYFANGNVIATNLDLESLGGTTINFTGIDGGVLNLSGALSSGISSSLTINETSSLGTGDVYFGNTNAAYNGLVIVNSGTAARLLDGGRTGVGSVQLNGGNFDILSSTGAQAMANTINSSSGTVFADLNYADAVVPAAVPTTHLIGPVTVDNPGALGGTTAASITFQADNEFNFESIGGLFLENTDGFAGPTRTVDVENGDLRTGIDGSTLQTGPNNLNKVVVTAQVDKLWDLNALGALQLSKTGGGVLAIGGNNQTTSEGAKFVYGGTLRFLTANSYGTTTGLVGGPAVTVTLEPTAGPGTPIGAAMGIGYVTGVPANLATAGTVPGQSGAFDVDFLNDPAAVFLNINNTGGALIGLRVGSSGAGLLVAGGVVIPYTPVGNAFSEYYLGGGGGSLTINTALAAGAAAQLKPAPKWAPPASSCPARSPSPPTSHTPALPISKPELYTSLMPLFSPQAPSPTWELTRPSSPPEPPIPALLPELLSMGRVSFFCLLPLHTTTAPEAVSERGDFSSMAAPSAMTATSSCRRFLSSPVSAP